MIEQQFNPMTGELENINYGARYGYWWKQYKKRAKSINNYSEGVAYFDDIPYKIKASRKHLMAWLNG